MSKFHVAFFCFAFAFVTNTSSLLAQNAENFVAVAQERFDRGDFFGALYEYERAMKVDSTNLNILYGYGTTLIATNNPKQATEYFKRAKQLDTKKSLTDLSYQLAEAFRLYGDYRNARKYYNSALTPYRGDKKSYMFQRISISKKANTWAMKQPEAKEIINSLGSKVNSTFSEFGSSMHDNKLYFSSLIADSLGPGNIVLDQHYFARIYSKSLDEETTKEQLTLSKKEYINFEKKHLSNPHFLGNQLFFTVCDTNFICEIYQGIIKSNKLIQVKKLNQNINNTTNNNTQPNVSIQKGDTVLYFVSNREGGFGGLDIWKSTKESYGFAKAINVGNEVNSMDNEITPYFDVYSNQLFFSSNWHTGFGGYDIFSSEKRGINYKSPKNLGKPYNSSYNDYYFYPFEQMAILSSNRIKGNIDQESACCNDLYETTFERTFVEEEDKLEKLNLVEIKVNEEELNKFLPLSLYFHNDSPKPNQSDTSTNASFAELASSYVSLQSEYQEKYISTLSGEQRTKENESLNHFFNNEVKYGNEQLLEITPLLIKELQKGNEITLSVRGFASALSDNEYNLKLTLRRIQSLINFLENVENGALVTYLNSGALKINKLPLGEYAVTTTISEDDPLEAIYSSQAALERKIEIIALRSSLPNSSLNKIEQPQIELDRTKHSAMYKKGSTVKRGVLIKNTGTANLKIYQILADNKLVKTNSIKQIAKGESERLIVEIFTNDLKGTNTIEIILVSNDPTNNMSKIEIKVRPVD